MVEAIVFDLDDTLYPERSFVESGYRAVARHIAAIYGGDFDSLFSTMITAWRSGGKKLVFPSLLKQFPEIPASMLELIYVYRRHTPQISMFPGYRELLQEWSSHYRTGIITDGIPEVQERKVMALGLAGIMNAIIYTRKYGLDKQKPHPLPFRLMLDYLQADPESSLFVGDDPEKDWRGAKAAGMKYVHVQNSFADAEDISTPKNLPEPVIQSLHQLPNILQELN
jgi:putative hydrolase of the HAD superfamily